MKTTFDRISGMTAEQRDKLAEQFEKASRVAGAEPIAVVGIGCRFPGGVTGPDSFWKLLESGTDAVTEVPADRWDAEAFYDTDLSAPGKMPTKWGAYLDDVSGFDADFFGISPREADVDGSAAAGAARGGLGGAGERRLSLPISSAESRTAVMLGVYYAEYQNASADNAETIDAYSATGNAHSVTVGRIAYLLGLKGPAVAVDTACSSSLVSIHLACQSLRMRESDLALAGGVSLNLRPETQLALAKWGMLSPHGRCHAFDSRADGFVRGEGAGVVVLKRLTDAVRDGDRVLGVVRGSAVNQDGRSNGLTAPNAPSQRDVLTRALRSADVAAGTVHYIETHGTGTGLGDPIEFDALAAVYGKGEVPCALGTVKTNMGHLEAAAGHRRVHQDRADAAARQDSAEPELREVEPADRPDADPAVRADRSRGVAQQRASAPRGRLVVRLQRHQRPHRGRTGPRNRSGRSGRPGGDARCSVSGKTPARLAGSAKSLADWLENDGATVPLADVAHTVNHHRSRYSTIATVTARDHAEAVTGLRALAAGQPAPGVVAAHDAKTGNGTVFLYSGQGAQWAGMGKSLLVEEPAFAAAVDELEPAFVDKVGFSLRQVLEAGEPVVGIDRIQPVLVGMQLALTALWRSYGVEPDAVIGHSMGEVTAAVVAGALTPAEGLDVIATRTRLMKRLSGQGAMALLELDALAAEKLIADRPDVTIAVYASPKQSVIAGPPDQVDELVAVVDAQGKLARRIEVDVASHHPTIDPVLPELRERPGLPGARRAEDPADLDRRLRGVAAAVQRGLLGVQPAQPGAVQPGGARRQRRAQHFHRDQPAPAADPRHRRHRRGRRRPVASSMSARRSTVTTPRRWRSTRSWPRCGRPRSPPRKGQPPGSPTCRAMRGSTPPTGRRTARPDASSPVRTRFSACTSNCRRAAATSGAPTWVWKPTRGSPTTSCTACRSCRAPASPRSRWPRAARRSACPPPVSRSRSRSSRCCRWTRTPS